MWRKGPSFMNYPNNKNDFKYFRNEYYSYDGRDLIGAVGGYFGLFLGWSFLSIFAWCIETVPNMRNNFKALKKFVPY